MKPYQKIIVLKKINEIELSDYKQQQPYPMNEHFRGSTNMISQNPCSMPQATYAETSLLVST